MRGKGKWNMKKWKKTAQNNINWLPINKMMIDRLHRPIYSLSKFSVKKSHSFKIIWTQLIKQCCPTKKIFEHKKGQERFSYIIIVLLSLKSWIMPDTPQIWQEHGFYTKTKYPTRQGTFILLILNYPSIIATGLQTKVLVQKNWLEFGIQSEKLGPVCWQGIELIGIHGKRVAI